MRMNKGFAGQHIFKKVCYFYFAAVLTASFLNQTQVTGGT